MNSDSLPYLYRTTRRRHIAGQVIVLLAIVGFLVAAVYVTIDPDPPGKMVVYEGTVQEIGSTEIHPTGYTAYETVLYLKMYGLDEVLGIRKRYSQDLDQYRLQIKSGDVIKVHFWSPGWQDS